MRIQRWNDRVDPVPGTMNGKWGGGVMEWRRSAGRRSFIREYAWQGDQSGREFKTWCLYEHEHNRNSGDAYAASVVLTVTCTMF